MGFEAFEKARFRNIGSSVTQRQIPEERIVQTGMSRY